MTPEAFRRYWEETYPACPPIGYRLRQTYELRWFRIHSLPASKRYAESEGEYREILRRHNTILTDLLGSDQPFVLVSTGSSETPTPALMQSEVTARYPTSQHFLSVHMDDDLGIGYWHFFRDELKWTPGMADAVLRQVAEAFASGVLFVNVARYSVYAPYDGGADIILPSVGDRDAMRHRYSGWLSAHPGGL